MEALVLIGGFLYLGVLGFWVMGKIDHFIDRGGFISDWDKEDAQSAASENNDTASLDYTKIKKTGKSDDWRKNWSTHGEIE